MADFLKNVVELSGGIKLGMPEGIPENGVMYFNGTSFYVVTGGSAAQLDNITGKITFAGDDATFAGHVTIPALHDLLVGRAITASTGAITATAGNIVASAGNIAATLGSLSAGTTVTAGTGITATTGNITATAGAFRVGANQVVGAAITGYIAADGAGASINASGTGLAINIATITATDGNIQALAKYVQGLAGAMATHGLIKA